MANRLGKLWLRTMALLVLAALMVSICGFASWDGHVCANPDCCAICRFAGLFRQLSCSELPAFLTLSLVTLSIAGISCATPRRDANTLVSRCVQLND